MPPTAHTPAFPTRSTATPTRTAARSLAAARPALRPARPLKIELAADPLAPVMPWGVDPATAAASSFGGGAIDARLGDLVDQANAQTLLLRQTLDEAVASDRVVRQHMSELVQRLQQGRHFGIEIDKRIESAGMAAGVLEKAATTLKGLEQVVEQIRAAQSRMDDQITARLNQQSEAFAQRLLELDARFESRLSEIESRYASAMDRADSAAASVTASMTDRLNATERSLETRADQLVANVDRHVAQAQARVSLVLDGASDRLEIMEQQSRRLGSDAFQSMENLCTQAVGLLGHDPRTATPTSQPAQGSLAHAVKAAHEIIDEANQSMLRIGAMQAGTRALVEELEVSQAKAAATVAEAGPSYTLLCDKLDAALGRATEADAALTKAVDAQQAAAARAEESSTLLSRQRDDLASVAAASEYHVAQAKDAAGALDFRIASAKSHADELDRAMTEVSSQAQSVLMMARKVAALTESRAEKSEKTSADPAQTPPGAN